MSKGYRSFILVEISRPFHAKSLYILTILNIETIFQRRNIRHGKSLVLHEPHPMSKGYRSFILVEISRPSYDKSLYILTILNIKTIFQRRNIQHGKS
jgi:hypothetical protein